MTVPFDSAGSVGNQLAIGADILVNTPTPNSAVEPKESPQVAALGDGRFVVTWTDWHYDGSGTAIRARLLNADGTAAADDFVVNTTTRFSQYNSSVDALPDGRFVVTWYSYDTSAGDGFGSTVIRARILNADGSPSPADFVVNSASFGTPREANVAALDDGRFVVTWKSSASLPGDSDNSGSAVHARIFAADGTATGSEFVINTTVNGDQSAPDVTALSDGRVFIAWTDAIGDGSSTAGYSPAIRGRIVHTDGTASTPDFQINTTTHNAQWDPSVTELSDGRILVAWSSDDGGDGSYWAVRGRILAADGTSQAQDFIINTTTFADQFEPSVAALNGGGFVVTWTDGARNGERDIRARVFDADGNASADFVVNPTTANVQLEPSVAALPDGRFVISWRENNAAGTGSSVHAVVLDPTSGNAPPQVSGPVVLAASAEDTPVRVSATDLLANASSGDDDPLQVSGLTVSSGQLVDNHDGTWTYTPASNDDGAVTFHYSVSDGHAAVATTASLDLTPVNDAPVVATPVEDQRASVGRPFSFTLPAATFGDIDAGDSFTLSASGLGDWLTFNSATHTFSGVPNPSAVGTVSITVVATDTAGATVSDTFDITVDEASHAPVAHADAATVREDAVLVAIGNLLANDSDPDGDALAIAAINGAPLPATGIVEGTYGVLRMAADGSYTYLLTNNSLAVQLLDPNAPAFDTFEYQVSDGNGGLSTATLVITVNGAQDVLVTGGTAAANTLRGGSGGDLIQGFGGNDNLNGLGGADFLDGGAGNDTLVGDNGNDRLVGGAGNDSITGGAGNDIMIASLVAGGTDGNDTYNGNGGVDTYDLSQTTAGAVVDLIAGTARSAQTVNDFASNPNSSDRLISIEHVIGSRGADTIIAASGQNNLTGWLGDDKFVFTSVAAAGKGSERDLITDFVQGEDRIDLSAIDANVHIGGGGSGGQSFSFAGFWNGSGSEFGSQKPAQVKYHYETIGGIVHTLIDGNVDNKAAVDFQIALIGQYELTAADFIL